LLVVHLGERPMPGILRLGAATILVFVFIVFVGFQSQPSSGSLPKGEVSNQPAPLGGSASKVEPPFAAYSYPDRQTFTYGVDWRLVTAGTTTLHLDTVNGERHIVASADSTGAVALLYHIHDRLETYYNPKTNCSLALIKHTEEGFRRVDTDVRYDYQRKKAVLDEHNLRAHNQKREETDIPPCVTNTVAAAYYVASQPLAPGAKFTFPSSDGGKSADIEVTVEAREQVKTPSGTYNTVRLSAEALNGPQKGKGKIWVWYTDDDRRIPVQMRARAFWGTMMFHLTQVTPAAQQRTGN
jgi:hypothetical protein